jgi:hypothetical protein
LYRRRCIPTPILSTSADHNCRKYWQQQQQAERAEHYCHYIRLCKSNSIKPTDSANAPTTIQQIIDVFGALSHQSHPSFFCFFLASTGNVMCTKQPSTIGTRGHKSR